MGDNKDRTEQKVPLRNGETTQSVIQGRQKTKSVKLGKKGEIGLILYFLVLFFFSSYSLLNLWPEHPEIKVGIAPQEEITAGGGTSLQEKEEAVEGTAEEKETEKAPSQEGTRVWTLWIFSLTVTREIQFILIVAIMGVLGGCIYSVRAFAFHVAKEDFSASWICWYFLRPLIGSALAVIFYFAFRSAFFSPSAGTEDLNIYGIATLGGIVGLFSKETIKKLEELFETILPIGKEDKQE
ncbi:MAG: hypothetical protein HXS40_01530 [Theionarchaea archaeon]|nr:hypothetical protein [Theionarchaea archaeon]